MKQGRQPKIPHETLIPELTARRQKGETAKVIARALGYSANYILELCARYEIKKTFKLKRAMEPHRFFV